MSKGNITKLLWTAATVIAIMAIANRVPFIANIVYPTATTT